MNQNYNYFYGVFLVCQRILVVENSSSQEMKKVESRCYTV